MAVIRINTNVYWHSGAWVFRGILEKVLDSLPPASSSLKDHIQRSFLAGVSFLNLELICGEELKTFGNALEQVRTDYLKRGPSDWGDSKTYQPFMNLLDELVDKVRKDPRYSENNA